MEQGRAAFVGIPLAAEDGVSKGEKGGTAGSSAGDAPCGVASLRTGIDAIGVATV